MGGHRPPVTGNAVRQHLAHALKKTPFNIQLPWFRGSAVLLFCCSAVLLFCCSAVPRFRGSVVLRFRGSAVPRFRSSAVLRFRGSAVLRFRGSAVLLFCCSAFPRFRGSAVRLFFLSFFRSFRSFVPFNLERYTMKRLLLFSAPRLPCRRPNRRQNRARKHHHGRCRNRLRHQRYQSGNGPWKLIGTIRGRASWRTYENPRSPGKSGNPSKPWAAPFGGAFRFALLDARTRKQPASLEPTRQILSFVASDKTTKFLASLEMTCLNVLR